MLAIVPLLFQDFETETKTVDTLTNGSWVKTSQAVSGKFQNDISECYSLLNFSRWDCGCCAFSIVFINHWPPCKKDTVMCEKCTELANTLGK